MVRSHLSLRSFAVRVRALRLCAAASLLTVALAAQDPPGSQPPPPPTSKKPTVPDYPDKRTITVGVFYYLTIPGSGPDLIGGKAATGYETLDGLGKQHSGPGVEVIVPITRTGEIHFEGFIAKGTGSQTAPTATTVYSTSYNKGDQLSTQFQTESAKLYLDDLLYPYKFPVSRFRLKSLWEVEYVGIKGTIDAPLKPTTDSSGNAVTTTGTGSNNIVYPAFGIAAEYAISPHVLLRAAGAGFGLPHRSELWDAEGTVAYRRGKWEIRAGVKEFHFKTSPQKAEYVTDTLSGGFVNLRYHWE
jgi:hypothetical protein